MGHDRGGQGPDADLFVTNVLNGTVAAKGAVVHSGTVLRLTVGHGGSTPAAAPRRRRRSARVSSEQTNAVAFIIGPTGVGLDWDGTLYVADTGENRITGSPCAERAVERGHRLGA